MPDQKQTPDARTVTLWCCPTCDVPLAVVGPVYPAPPPCLGWTVEHAPAKGVQREYVAAASPSLPDSGDGRSVQVLRARVAGLEQALADMRRTAERNWARVLELEAAVSSSDGGEREALLTCALEKIRDARFTRVDQALDPTHLQRIADAALRAAASSSPPAGGEAGAGSPSRPALVARRLWEEAEQRGAASRRRLNAAGDRLYQALALFDRRDGSALAGIVRSAREGWERSADEMDEPGAWDDFDRLIASYEPVSAGGEGDDGLDRSPRARAGRAIAAAPAFGLHGSDTARRVARELADVAIDAYLDDIARSSPPVSVSPDGEGERRSELTITDGDGDALSIVEGRGGRALVQVSPSRSTRHGADGRVYVWLEASDQRRLSSWLGAVARREGDAPACSVAVSWSAIGWYDDEGRERADSLEMDDDPEPQSFAEAVALVRRAQRDETGDPHDHYAVLRTEVTELAVPAREGGDGDADR